MTTVNLNDTLICNFGALHAPVETVVEAIEGSIIWHRDISEPEATLYYTEAQNVYDSEESLLASGSPIGVYLK